MNIELGRLFFGAVEDSAFHYGMRFRVSPANIVHCRKAGSSDSGTPPVHLQPVQATNKGAPS